MLQASVAGCGALLKGLEPPAQRRGMAGEPFPDLFAELASVHMNREIAILSRLDCGLGVFVG
jgi:hypothetical protein